MRGAPLPPLGSFQERIASELLMRERNEKFACVALFAKLLGEMGKVDVNVIGNLLEEYGEELYQLRYNLKYKNVHQRTISKIVAAKEERSRLMNKLDELTENAPPLPSEKRR